MRCLAVEVLEEFVEAGAAFYVEESSIRLCREKLWSEGRRLRGKRRVAKKHGLCECEMCGAPVEQKDGRGRVRKLCNGCFLRKHGR